MCNVWRIISREERGASDTFHYKSERGKQPLKNVFVLTTSLMNGAWLHAQFWRWLGGTGVSWSAVVVLAFVPDMCRQGFSVSSAANEHFKFLWFCVVHCRSPWRSERQSWRRMGARCVLSHDFVLKTHSFKETLCSATCVILYVRSG